MPSKSTDRFSLFKPTIFLFERSSFFLFFIQLSYFICFCFLFGMDAQITYLSDGDASRNIGVTTRAFLFSDTGFYNYGPVYYRLANILGFFIPNLLYYPTDTVSFIQSTASTNLRIVSLAFLYIPLWFLAKFLVLSNWRAYALIVVTVSFLLINPTWERYVFRIYPDLALSGLLLLSFLCAFQSLNPKQHSRRWLFIILSGLFWAAAFQTKISAIFYLPGLTILLLQDKLFSLKNIAIALISGLLTLLLGYPQNEKMIYVWHKAITKGHTFSEEVTLDWIYYVITNYWEQFSLVAPVFLFVTVLFYREIREQIDLTKSFKYFLGSVVAGAAPLVVFMISPLSSGTTHYAMSVVMVHMILLPVLVVLSLNFLSAKLPSASDSLQRVFTKFDSDKIKPLIYYSALSIIFVSFGISSYIPDKLVETYKVNRNCFAEFEEFKETFYSRKGKVFSTPNSPYFEKANLPEGITVNDRWWTLRREELEQDVNGMLVSTQFMKRFLSDHPRTKQYNFKTYRQNQEMVDQITTFVKTLTYENTFTDTHGNSWEKLGSYPNCRFDYWIKSKS